MIKINLLPEELKIKTNVTAKKSIDPSQFIYLVPVAIACLLIVHLYLFIAVIFKGIQLNMLNAKWKELEPRRKAADIFKREYQALSEDVKLMQEFVKGRINSSMVLNRLSLDLPGGVWFNELTLNNKELIIQGSVFSFKKEEVGQINKFIDNLKQDSGFFMNFDKIELGAMQARTIAGYEVVDFTISGTLKVK
jgi:Tfp pilus assembly protein PilN